MCTIIDADRHEYGVEPICLVMEIAPSGYDAAKHGELDLSRLSPRAQVDTVLREGIRMAHAAHFGVCSVRMIWHQRLYNAQPFARCTVEQLMGVEGFLGFVRGAGIRSTRPAEDPAA
jgi:putative transposase